MKKNQIRKSVAALAMAAVVSVIHSPAGLMGIAG